MNTMSNHKSTTTLVFVLAAALASAAIGSAPSALAQAASAGSSAATPAPAGGSGTVVIVSITDGSTNHAVEATSISVNSDKTEATVTIRDPECPNKTSTIKINIKEQKITEHTGEPCHSYVGWKVRGIVKIEKP